MYCDSLLYFRVDYYETGLMGRIAGLARPLACPSVCRVTNLKAFNFFQGCNNRCANFQLKSPEVRLEYSAVGECIHRGGRILIKFYGGWIVSGQNNILLDSGGDIMNRFGSGSTFVIRHLYQEFVRLFSTIQIRFLGYRIRLYRAAIIRELEAVLLSTEICAVRGRFYISY